MPEDILFVMTRWGIFSVEMGEIEREIEREREGERGRERERERLCTGRKY